MRILYGLKGYPTDSMVITDKSRQKTSESSNLDDILSEALPLDPPQSEKKPKLKPDLQLPCKKQGEKVDTETGFSWLEKLTEEQTRLLIIYVYRLQPVINREPKYIEKYESTDCGNFTFNYLKSAHGGGMYEVSVNELGSGIRLFRFQIVIDSNIYPPIIPIKEIDTGSSKNEQFIGNKIRKGEWKYENGILVEIEKDKQNMNPQTNIDHVAIIDSAFKSVRETMQLMKPDKVAPTNDLAMIISMMNANLESQRLASENMMKQMQANSDNQMKMILALLNQPKPEPPPKDDSMIKFLLEESKAAKEQTAKLIETMVAQKPSVDPMKQILSTMEVMRELKEGLGGETVNEPKDWKERLADVAIQHGPNLLGMIAGGLAAQHQGLSPEMGIANVTTSSNGPVGYDASNPVPNQPRPIPSQPQPVRSEIDQLLATPAVMAIVSQKINEGVRGWEFGSLISELYGRPIYNQIANVGKDELFAAINRNNQLKNAISTFSDEKLKIWVSEFVDMDSEIDKQEIVEEKELVN